ncbi:MAG: chorismate synthase, partial [Bacillota bacterium]|nr:chorismate synthase [Bacillota bacterium]
KYHTEVRNILERASARETAMRVAIGSIARQGLSALGVEIKGHVLAVGGVHAKYVDDDAYWKRVKQSEWSVGDPNAEQQMGERLKAAQSEGESLGGLLEVQVHHLTAGLGSHVQWDRKLDGRLAQAVLSVQAMKGISFGLGFELGDRMGSKVHDPIYYREGQGFKRRTNHAGGIEGGMSNGEPIILQAVMKPIPTLYQPLETVHLETKEVVKASVERSDVCAVPAALVVLEHVVAWVIAEAVLEKFPADSFSELQAAWEAYQKYLTLN